MTEWNRTADAGDAVDEASLMTQPMPRTARRSALRSAPSRRHLYADAREQARLVRGRNAFVWQGRVLPIGIPLAAAAGFVSWRRSRSTRDALTAIVSIGVASYLEARVEWSLRRNAYRRRRDTE
jgi:hypothetical protein